MHATDRRQKGSFIQMSRVVVTNNLTLDGVMQAPARPDEDRRGGFTHGGWALPYNDAVMGRVMGEGMAKGGALLLGRRTYEDFYAVWPVEPTTRTLRYSTTRRSTWRPRHCGNRSHGATPRSSKATPRR